VLDVPAALALGIGMSVAQARAVLSGLLGQTGEFVRTPKRGDAPAATRYRLALARWPWLESVYSAWFALGIARAVAHRNWEALPFLALFFTGFAWVGGLALRESWRGRAPRRPQGEAGEAAHVLAGEVTAG
jgi:hypothetical protein